MLIILFLLLASRLSDDREQVGTSHSLPAELRTYVERFTGSNPVDCGQHFRVCGSSGSTEELQASIQSARDSSKDRKPFLTFVQLPGIDSLVFNGILGTPGGTIHTFSFDSDPSGGSFAPGRFDIQGCAKAEFLIVDRRGSLQQFVCRRY